jgi:hypothetical protein
MIGKIQKLEKYTKIENVKNFIKDILPKVYVDKSYQRYEVWSTNSKFSFINSMYRGLVANPIILVDVEMCKMYNHRCGNKEDYNYFNNISERGFLYISVDGNNRSQTINSYHTNDLTKVLYNDTDKEYFGEIQLDLVIYRIMTKNDIHELAVNTNKGDSWNPQESRNALNTPMSGFVREKTEEIITILTNKVKLTNIKRMKGDELLVKMLAYENYGKTCKLTQQNLDKVYKTKDVEIINFTKNLNTLKNMMEYHTTNVKLHCSEFFNLYLFISYLNKNNLKINDNNQLYLDYHKTQLLRRVSEKTYKSQNGKFVTWSGLNGNIGLDYNIKLETILTDINMDKHITVKDAKRNFTTNQKVEIWENNDGMVRVNNQDKHVNGEVYNEYGVDFIKVTLMELLTTEYVVDHIVPHTHGGQTLIENGEVTTKEYNSWKGKRIYDNEMTIS